MQTSRSPSLSPRLSNGEGVGERSVGSFISKMNLENDENHDSISVYTLVYTDRKVTDDDPEGLLKVWLMECGRGDDPTELAGPVSTYHIDEVHDATLRELGLNGADATPATRNGVRELETVVLTEDDGAERWSVVMTVESLDQKSVLSARNYGQGGWHTRAEVEGDLVEKFVSEGLRERVVRGFEMLENQG